MTKGKSFFEIPLQRMRKFAKGEKITALKLNRHIDTTNRLRGVLPASQIKKGREPTSRLQIVSMKVKEVKDDHLICVLFENGQVLDEDNEINVAKPFELQRTFWDLQTVNNVLYTYLSATERDADNSVDAIERQVIVPSYLTTKDERSTIFAVVGIAGGTNIKVGVPPFETDVIYQDMNFGARAWSKESD